MGKTLILLALLSLPAFPALPALPDPPALVLYAQQPISRLKGRVVTERGAPVTKAEVR